PGDATVLVSRCSAVSSAPCSPASRKIRHVQSIPSGGSMNIRARLVWISCVLACLISGNAQAQQLEIHYINVGWGGSVLVRGPNGTTVLMEAGNTGKGSGRVIPYLQSIGMPPATGLDYTIAGHQHCDHIGGLDEVINAGYNVHLRNFYNGSTYS